MKCIKGNQTYQIEDLPLQKVNLVADGETEGLWVRQAEHEVILQNHAFAFFPYPSWGAVLPSTNPPGAAREVIDVTKIRGSSPKSLVLTFHPEAWDSMLKSNIIDTEGNLLPPPEEQEKTDED